MLTQSVKSTWTDICPAYTTVGASTFDALCEQQLIPEHPRFRRRHKSKSRTHEEDNSDMGTRVNREIGNEVQWWKSE